MSGSGGYPLCCFPTGTEIFIRCVTLIQWSLNLQRIHAYLCWSSQLNSPSHTNEQHTTRFSTSFTSDCKCIIIRNSNKIVIDIVVLVILLIPVQKSSKTRFRALLTLTKKGNYFHVYKISKRFFEIQQKSKINCIQSMVVDVSSLLLSYTRIFGFSVCGDLCVCDHFESPISRLRVNWQNWARWRID